MDESTVKRRLVAIGACFALFYSASSQASCGSAFCVINTDWTTQGMLDEAGAIRLDLRYEFIDQNSLRHGSHSISRAQDNEEEIELRTLNRNLLATLDYIVDKNWSVTAFMPVVDKSHSHISDPEDTAVRESWDFTRMGDMRLLTTYRFDNGDNPSRNIGIRAGIKLPTGDYKIRNDEGVLAERSLQPGTGSTDFILGAFYSAVGFSHNSSWFAEGTVQTPLETQDHFRPGNQYQLNIGYRQPVTESLQALLQINSIVKERDTGSNSESDVSGLKTIYLSPGLSYGVSKNIQTYGFVQLPVYRYVNGTQLSADWSAVVGMTMRF